MRRQNSRHFSVCQILSIYVKPGIYLAPAQFEAMFISNAHTEQEINTVLSIANDFFRNEI